jgi:hypothetical protein
VAANEGSDFLKKWRHPSGAVRNTHRRSGFKYSLGRYGCLEQLFDLTAQLGFARAGPIQINLLLVGRTYPHRISQSRVGHGMAA